MTEQLTPSQTIGPFLAIGLPWPDGPDVAPEGTPGRIMISGYVFDGAGEPVVDALVETWQADADGCFVHPDDPRGASTGSGFRGFGRCPTGPHGEWHIHTVMPGALPTADGGVEAPHLNVSVFARGLLDRLVTRIYFADDPGDPVLAGIEPARRRTLVATPEEGGYRFDINLQGDDETVFFDV